MSKPYIICAFDHAFESGRYFWSMKFALENTVRPIVLMYEPYCEIALPKDGLLIRMGKRYPGNTGRIKDIHELFPSLNLDKDAWIFFTDVHDVVFQCPLPVLPDDADILIAPEGKKFGEIEFWKERFASEVHEWQAFNCGTFGMRYDAFKAYLDMVWEKWTMFLDWYKKGKFPDFGTALVFPFAQKELMEKEIKTAIAKTFNSYHDTMIYNVFLHTTKYRIKEVPGLFGCYAFNYELGNLIRGENEKTYTKDGKLISIVHFNGNTKSYLKNDL